MDWSVQRHKAHCRFTFGQPLRKPLDRIFNGRICFFIIARHYVYEFRVHHAVGYVANGDIVRQ